MANSRNVEQKKNKKMKKFIFLIVAMFVTVASFGQAIGTSGESGWAIKASQSWFQYDGATADTLPASPYALAKTISIDEPGFYNYYINVDVDSAGDGGGVTVALKGRTNSLEGWTSITSVSWSGEVDTTIAFTNKVDYYTTDSLTYYRGGVNWPELQISFTGSDAAADISLDDIVGIINRRDE